MGLKQWLCLTENRESEVAVFTEKFKFPRPIAQFLVARNITEDSVDKYLNTSLRDLSDPFIFPNMDKAAKRLWDAISNQEPILIHGDYDTDGITSTVLLLKVLQQNGAIIDSFLPHRFDDGYGFTPESLEKAISLREGGYKLLITVDCGINSIAAVEYANEHGIDVIVTDHHEPEEALPNALALINPKVYPELADLHLLAGVGVAFKLAHAFIKYGRQANLGGMRTNLQDILDYVALGTIADIVPLLGENRIFVKYGIEILSKQLRPGVRALFEMAHIKQALRPSDITFKLAPRINAAGRLGDADVALSLLNTDNIIEAYDFANKLEAFNIKRQEKEQDIFQEARQQILEMEDKDSRYSFVVSGEEWHQGVIGIVASRLSREFNRPVIVLTIQGDEAHGSGRSIKSLNLVVTLHKCADLLDRFGGHPMAVGVTLSKDKIPVFAEAFEESVRETLSRADLVDFIEYDGVATLRDFDDEVFGMLPKIGPFGHSNQQPLFRVKNVQPERIFPAGENHTRGTIYDATGTQFEFIAFNKKIDMFPKNNWDIIVTPQLNSFFTPPRPQLQIIHINDEA